MKLDEAALNWSVSYWFANRRHDWVAP